MYFDATFDFCLGAGRGKFEVLKGVGSLDTVTRFFLLYQFAVAMVILNLVPAWICEASRVLQF